MYGVIKWRLKILWKRITHQKLTPAEKFGIYSIVVINTDDQRVEERWSGGEET